jgi:hypothetical protein
VCDMDRVPQIQALYAELSQNMADSLRYVTAQSADNPETLGPDELEKYARLRERRNEIIVELAVLEGPPMKK